MSWYLEFSSRRAFITRAGLLAGAAALCGPAAALAAQEKGEPKSVEVTPTEDLMQDTGCCGASCSSMTSSSPG